MGDYSIRVECPSESKQAANRRQMTRALCLCGAPWVSFRYSLPFRESAFWPEKLHFPEAPTTGSAGSANPSFLHPSPPHCRSVMTQSVGRGGVTVFWLATGAAASTAVIGARAAAAATTAGTTTAAAAVGRAQRAQGEGLAGGASGLDCGSDGQGD